jgi:uncharacterized membrane protein YccF (DUF307 family)
MSTYTVVTQERGAGLLLRAIYFIFIGLWLSGIWAAVAWLLCITILGLPLGLWMLNRLPQITTLAPQRADLVVDSSGRVLSRDVPQYNFLLRAIYFLLVGWWFSALWLSVAWALCAIIIGMPIGFWMFNRVPAIVSLRVG